MVRAIHIFLCILRAARSLGRAFSVPKIELKSNLVKSFDRGTPKYPLNTAGYERFFLHPMNFISLCILREWATHLARTRFSRGTVIGERPRDRGD